MVKTKEVKTKVVKKEDLVIKEWNNLVQGFLDARTSWEKLKLELSKISNQDLLDPELQRLLARIVATTRFRYAATSFVDLLGIRDNVEDLFIKEEIKDEDY